MGAAGDGLWNNPANWSTTEASYTASTAYPNDATQYSVHLYTHLVADHAVSITIPAGCTDAACLRIRVKDDSAPGTVEIVGAGSSRVPLKLSAYPNDNYNGGFVRTAFAYPVKITCRNIHFSDWLYFNWSNKDAPSYWTDTVANGDGFALYNCCYTNYPTATHAQINPPGGANATCTIVDSTIVLRYFVRANPNGTLTIAVTNSTLSVSERMRIDGPNTTFDFVGSTLKIGAEASSDPKLLFGDRTDDAAHRDIHAGMKIRFKDSTIDFTELGASSSCAIYTRASGRELVFDNAEIKGDLYAIQLPDVDSVTRVKDTSLHFKRSNAYATYGIFYLDNGEWVMDTGHIELSGGMAHFIFSGAAPCLDPGWMDYKSNTPPPVFDFIVPAGGYKQAPISLRYSTDGQDKGVFGTIPNAAPNQGTINVLPESAAAKTAGTTICPLVYAKDTKARVHLGRGVPTMLPNEKSSFLYTTNGTWDYDAVASKTESDWMQWDGTAGVMGLAVKIVGSAVHRSGSASITPVPGYEMLEYLESSGTQYIDTGVVYANDTKLTQRFCVVDFAGAQMQMGALDRIANVWHRFHWGVAGESTLRYIKWIGLANVSYTTLPAGADGWVDVSIDASDQSYTEDGHNTIAIFARNESGTFTCGKFRVGITRIWKGTDLVRLLVPARRLSDNALGLYDYCEPKFYENGGSGEFAAGPAMKYLVVAKAIPDSLQSIDSPVEAYCPLPVVKEEFTGRTLTKDVDYTVAWMNNTRFGEGTCTVSGAGDYATATPGSATFLIVPQAKLPHEFQRLLYLETKGTVHYVDTDIHPTANTRITAVAQTTANANTYFVGILDTPQWCRFHLGAKWMTNQKFYLAGGVGGNETQYTNDDRLLIDAGWNKLTMDAANKVLSVNDGTTYALGTSGTLPTESTLRIFGRASNSESHNAGNPVRIADVAIYESGEKTHEYIPCRRESDGVLGLYDVVGKQFLVNSGSAQGGFLAGPELKDDWVSGFIYIVR